MNDTDIQYLLREIGQQIDYNMPNLPPQQKAQLTAGMLRERVKEETLKKQQTSMANLIRDYESPQYQEPDYPYMEERGYSKVPGGGYYVPPEERQGLSDEHTKYIQAKQALAPQSITAGGRTATTTPTDASGQPYPQSAYTFTNEDLIPTVLTGKITEKNQYGTPQGMADLFMKASQISPQAGEDIRTYLALRQKPERKVTVHDIPVEGKIHKVGLDEAGNQVIDYGEAPDKDRIQILQTDEGYVEYNKATKKVTPLGIQKPLTAEQQKDWVQLRNVKSALEDVKVMYKPEYTGVYQGGIAGSTYKKLGIGTSEDEQTFRARNAVLYQMLYSLSGKQVSVPEWERIIKPYIPMPGDSDLEYSAKLKQLDKSLTQIESDTIKVRKGGINSLNKQGRFTVKEIP